MGSIPLLSAEDFDWRRALLGAWIKGEQNLLACGRISVNQARERIATFRLEIGLDEVL
jgi:hypothetical protein